MALGGNALLQRGQPLTASHQRQNVKIAARALAPLGRDHELVVSHGNGPQVGLLALQAAALGDTDSFPLDVLGAQTEGMIGYMIEQELGNLLPFEQPLATILTMVEVDPQDPAFDNPSKPIGPVYEEAEATRLADERGWTVAREDGNWRRVVPSPEPRRIFEIRPIKWLLERGVIVICAGGGGIPTMYRADGTLQGAAVVIDKDLASALLACELEADLLILATDVDGVYERWGESDQRLIRHTTPAELDDHRFAAGSMAPKVRAACNFVRATGARAAVGALEDLEHMVTGDAGTVVEAK